MKLSKEEINNRAAKTMSKYPLIKKYFLEVVSRLIDKHQGNVKELLELQLIRYLITDEKVLANLEKHLSDRKFTNIEVPINRLKNNFAEYSSVMFELHVAKILSDEGMTDIFFLDEEGYPDIQYKENKITRYAEVKSLEDLDPEFPVIDNKLEAMSLVDDIYKKDFYIRLNDASINFMSLEKYREKLDSTTNAFIKEIRKELDKNSVEDLKVKIREFEFTLSFNTKRPGYNLMYSGDVMKFGSSKDIFLNMHSVYSRFINCAAKGIKQLAKKREKNLEEIKQDRLYIFLNSGRNAKFIPNELKRIIDELAKVIGISELVNLKIEL